MKLLKQNKTLSYLLYAFGEILLVMIGILLALQVNNWNENRIERNQELKVLTQIRSDLAVSETEINDLIFKVNYSTNSADSVLQSFRNNNELQSFVFHISLLHRLFFFNPAQSGYSQLENSYGILVSNGDLRNQVTELYEGDFREITKIQGLIMDNLNQNLAPLSNKYFDLTKRLTFRIDGFDENSMDFYTPLNFSQLANNQEYANTIVTQKRLYIIQSNQLNKTLATIQSALLMLDYEISLLSS